MYTNDICSKNYKQIKEIIQALIEMCVGNAANQQVVLDKQVVDSINRILQLGNMSSQKSKETSNLNCNCDESSKEKVNRVSGDANYVICSVVVFVLCGTASAAFKV